MAPVVVRTLLARNRSTSARLHTWIDRRSTSSPAESPRSERSRPRTIDGVWTTPCSSTPFSHPGNPEHVERLADYWAEVFGGPPRYSESFGGHPGMLGIHAGQSAEEDLGTRFLACFVQAVDDAGLPEDPAFRGALRAYMEWAVDEALAFSPAGARVPDDLRVPRWTWDGLQPRG
jgi:hemoglobin